LVLVALWLVALLCYWWPRRLRSQAVGLTTVAAMVVIGAVLATSSLAQCRGGQTQSAVVGWVLNLYLGNSPPYPSGACQGQPPLALQVGGVVCLGATLVGALAVAATLWQQPLGRLRARLVRDATVLIGLDTLTMPLLRRLAQSRRPGNIVVIEPDGSHPLLGEARATGARVMIGDPASPSVLLPVIADGRGCALSYLYALRQNASENEAILVAAGGILRRFRADPERQPHLVARIDDPRHADHWRGLHNGTASSWFEDALSSQESTAYALVSQISHTGARNLLLCGDSTLALAVLLELARSAWERRGLAEAAAAGSAAHPGVSFDEAARHAIAPRPLESVVLLDQRAKDLKREYLATSPPSGVEAMPTLVAETGAWKDRLLAILDEMPHAAAAQTAVAIADAPTEAGMHEAGRVARLHPDIPVFVLAPDGAGTSSAIFDLLLPFQRTLLADGEVPEDTWTRVARHWHECFRLRHPPVPGDRRTLTGRPWDDLNDFIRHDNLLQLRSVMTAVVARGRRWVPDRSVPPGSFIELNDCDLEAIARAEHTRWYKRRVAAGWSARGRHDSTDAAITGTLVNSRVVPWADLMAEDRAASIDYLRSQLAQLEDVGFMPVVPSGGPPEAAEFQRIGTVRAKRLSDSQPWTRSSGDELRGDEGDWQVIDDFGDDRTIRDAEFRASYESLGGELWRRTGTFRAWQVSENLVLRTMEGKAIARVGDWVVEGYHGERWPVDDEQFRRTYRMRAGAAEHDLPASPQSTPRSVQPS
jgi:Trk K+ transport system NAD-binding subunit